MAYFSPSFVGILKYKELTTNQTKEIQTNHFWGSSYLPNEVEMRIFLKQKGYTHIGNVSYCRVM